MQKQDFLYYYLENYWLRPENALWQALVANIVSKYPPSGSSLDFGCGDGTFSFICNGGRLSKEFDFFVNVSQPNNLFTGSDIYNTKIDNINSIGKNAEYIITTGADYKYNLLEKSSKLKFYKNCVQLNGNNRFPFTDNSFNYIFSNALYWLNNVKKSLNEFKRIIKKKGIMILVMLSKDYPKYCFTSKPRGYYKEILSKINFNRHQHYKYLVKPNNFEKILSKTGFSITNKYLLFSKHLVYLEDIGLRPISPFLISMANNLDMKIRNEIKYQMVDYFYDLLLPLYKLEKQGIENGKNAIYIYIIRRN
ncbi:MAG TPA: methyltransferase domain-containing protein [bacterium]|nr:methyltransferase domain-containing protein [bacterium]